MIGHQLWLLNLRRFITMKAIKELASGPTTRGSRGSEIVSERSRQIAIIDEVISEFFESIAGPHPEVPRTISGSLRFDLENGNRSEHWLVIFTKGKVSSDRSNAAADCVAHTDKATMEAIIQGRVNAMAAILRGAIKLEGQILLFALFRSLLTTPAERHQAQRVGRNTGRRS
jgi:putative sterol carrier protein